MKPIHRSLNTHVIDSNCSELLAHQTVDYVQAFVQAPIEKTLYMKLPAGMTLDDGSDPKEYVLQIEIYIWAKTSRTSKE